VHKKLIFLNVHYTTAHEIVSPKGQMLNWCSYIPEEKVEIGFGSFRLLLVYFWGSLWWT